jgi:hypothetical protein
VWKARVADGSVQHVTRGGGREAADGAFLYYHRFSSPGVWRVPVAGGEEAQVLNRGRQGGWALWKEGISFFHWKPSVGPTVQLFDLKSHRIQQIAKLPVGTNMDESVYNSLEVSPDGSWLLYVRADPESDVMLLENFRFSRGRH